MINPSNVIPKILLLASCLVLSACISTPAPKYQPGIENTSRLIDSKLKMTVGPFTAAQDVENDSLGMRGSQLKGGSDGTYATYLREALIAELQASGGLIENGHLVLSGQLTDNRLNAGNIKTGTANVGARFVLQSGSQTLYDKTLAADHQWDSSFIGAIAIPAAIDNYATAVQKLINKLLSDPEFISAAKQQP